MRQQSNEKQIEYIESLLASETAEMKKSREAADRLGLGHISVSPSEAKIIQTIVALHKCRTFVEIGTLTGLSAQYILGGMCEQGKLISLEKEPEHARIALEIVNPFAESIGKKFEVVTGDARQTLQMVANENFYDGIFIDGNKAAYGDYLDWAEKNVRKGGLVIADNVFLRGTVWGAEAGKFSPKQIQVMQKFNQRLMDSSLYESCLLPTGEGLLVAIKKF